MSKNSIKLIHGGKEYFDLLLELISNATESIHLQTYIYDDDETGRSVGEALKAAAKRKVAVHLLADGYASKVMSKNFIEELREAGVQVRLFEPLLRSKYFYFGRRMHQKVFVADAKFSMVGGINITNRYNDLPGKKAWFDFAVFAEGEISRQLCVHCWKTWYGFPAKMNLTPCEEKVLYFDFTNQEVANVKMKRNDWVRRKNEISESFFDMFKNAKSQITIVCSYFLPGTAIRHLLSKAASRGVKIRVITAGPSDVMLAKYAERWLYDWLLRHNIELYEYQPAVLHAKLAICDSEWFTIGSFNLNNVSAYASIELNLDVYHPGIAAKTELFINSIVKKDCVPITFNYHAQSKNIFKQFIRWFSYQFIRTVFYLLTFYYTQKK